MNILVVDDDPEIRESLKDVLEAEGYAVDVAANGREALERVRSETPSLVLLDLMMPIMSGGEVLAELRRSEAHLELPVIVLSAWPTEAEQVSHWANGILKKPARLEVLLNTVERFCGPPPADRPEEEGTK
jgi:two-component system response regulator MprA